ncbi:phosphonate C-P lyase system protein PhnH [Roseovarius sp. CH_XMU1461]|uniref:phosphonate C-P lyase system protein PhnH n=1 Tax=Roseovarius sp. CH_XMU1461 TaxID=3107777 RepID=UPI0030096464
MSADTLQGGFADAPREAARAFRACLDVMARPGTIAEVSGAVPPAPLSIGTGVILLTLCDPDTPVYLAGRMDSPEIRQWISFHAGAPITGTRAEASFAFGTWEELLPLAEFPIGSAEYPDRSTTLVVALDRLEPDMGARISGPGIRDVARLPLPDTEAFQDNHLLYPQGLDFFFTAGARIAALPRSTKVEGV